MKTLSPPRPALDLPPHLSQQLVYTLTDLLPPPLDDTPEALAARNHAAISKVAALLPVDANEVDLAAQCIAARAQAEDVLRLLRQHAGDIALVTRLNAQYGSMVRTSLSVHGRLMRVQALRRKRESIDGAASADAWARDKAELSMLKAAFRDAGPLQATSPEPARPTSPEGARPTSPEGARPTSPEGARPMSPARARPTSPEGARPMSPARARPTSPEGARPTSPARARPMSPARAPADRVNQMTEEPAPENETYSQDVAFETWLSEQPWNLMASGETVLNDLLREALARSRLADREPAANSR